MNSEPMVIDVDALVKQRMPRHYRYIPRFVTRRLAKIIRERELNELLHLMAGKEPEDAAAAVLKRLQIGVNVLGEEHIPSEGRFIFVSNHPLGGLDGLALSRQYPIYSQRFTDGSETAAEGVFAGEQIWRSVAREC